MKRRKKGAPRAKEAPRKRPEPKKRPAPARPSKAEQRRRSQAAKKAARTRAENAAKKAARSAAARRGWETRELKRVEREQRRSAAAAKGWQTRRERERFEREERAAIVEELPAGVVIPPGMVEAFESLESRAEQYPNVRRAALEARRRLLDDERARIDREIEALGAGREPPPMTERDQARARLATVDTIAGVENEIRAIASEGEFSQRELYQLYFSPDAA